AARRGGRATDRAGARPGPGERDRKLSRVRRRARRDGGRLHGTEDPHASNPARPQHGPRDHRCGRRSRAGARPRAPRRAPGRREARLQTRPGWPLASARNQPALHAVAPPGRPRGRERPAAGVRRPHRGIAAAAPQGASGRAVVQALAGLGARARRRRAAVALASVGAPLPGQARFRLADETLTAFAALRAWAQHNGVQVVLPQTERSCILCNLQREEWEALGIAVGCGPADLILRAFDKACTLELAEACGVRVPPRHVPTSLADGLAGAAALGYPVVVKPRFSHFWEGGRFVSGDGSRYACDPVELEAQMHACRQDRFWPLIQGFVPGQGKGVFALYDHGTPLAWFAHERLRDVRPSGSGSSLRRSIPLDPRLQAPAARLLAAWAWHGPAMVEFRDDGESEPCLIEVNGRFWGSLDLAVASGVDFPTLWVRLLRDEPVDPPAGYETGVTSRWLWGDFKRVLNILKGRPPGYPEPYPSVLEGLREVLGPQPPGTRSETWNADDRWPALGEWVQGIAGLVRPARPRRRPASVAKATTAPPVGGQAQPVRVLMITSGWPQPGQPQTTHFIKRQAEFLRAAGV